MLKEFTISGGDCFGASPLTVGAIDKVNFFFGANGSGKTTISRAFAGYSGIQVDPVWGDDQEMAILVYNRDFVDSMLGEAERIPGVFVLGEKSAKAQARIDEITGPKGDWESVESKRKRAESSYGDALRRKQQGVSAFRKLAWDKYQAFTETNPTLKPAFTGPGGIGNSKQRLEEKLVDLPDLEDGESPPNLEGLLAQARAVFDANASRRDELALLPSFDVSTLSGVERMSAKILGSSEVRLATLIDEIGHQDWVREGSEYLLESHELCPFCQQKAPDGLLADLESIFDDRYSKEVEEIETLRDRLQAWTESFESLIASEAAESRVEINQLKFERALGSLREKLTTNAEAVRVKLDSPSVVQVFAAFDDEIEAVSTELRAANELVREHNSLIDSRKTASPALRDLCWRYVREVLVRQETTAYCKLSSGHDTGVSKTLEQFEAAKDELAELSDSLRDLRRSVTSSEPVIDDINALLSRSGFTSFKIVKSFAIDGGYMLARNGVALVERSLSEGERTFISFLYYYFSLDSQEAVKEFSRVVAVIDDPISSLDSDALFVVSTLVRKLIARSIEGADHLAQVIVLTHNVHFHKEITELRFKDRDAGRRFFLVRKFVGRASLVEAHGQNPISTEYERLWSEVRRAAAGDDIGVVGLENTIRRILENYFRIAGGIWVEDLVEMVEPEERVVLSSMFDWLNVGSHSVHENLHYSPSESSVATYIALLERVFDVSEHRAHYKMMMRQGA